MPPVQNLMLYVTEDCNLRCTYCFVKKTPRTMTLETAKKAIDWMLKAHVTGHQQTLDVTFFGGEPLLQAELMLETIRYARLPRPGLYKDFRFFATTNGTLSGPKVEQVVREGGLQLLISFDGDLAASRERPHLSGAESYSKVAKNIPRLLEWAPESIIRMTFHPGSLRFVENIRHALQLGATRIALCPVVESDWAGHEAALEAAHEELGEWFFEEFARGLNPPLVVTRQMLQAYHGNHALSLRPHRPCPVGQQIGINTDGKVMPCHRFLGHSHHWLGTVDDKDWPRERWQYAHLKSSDFPECATCEARSVCGGGCRVVALEGGYGLHGINPKHCLLTRSHFRMVERIYQKLHQDKRFLRYLRQEHRLAPALQELSRFGN